MSRRPLVLLAVVAALLAGYGLVGGGDTDEPDGPFTSATTRPASTLSADDARRRLPELAVLERRPAGVPRYSRDAFGPAWADIDDNGCNQRDDVLLRDAVPDSTVARPQGSCPHDVLAGTWVDPYTGTELTFDDLKAPTQAQALQIDHVVPLAEAWQSGAHRWRDERRVRFANDLDGLLAVDGPTNASKGSDDPAAWRPRQGYQCRYAARWISVKHRWELAADVSEVAALEQMLDACPG
ncbi:HNH endonuclease family protein [Aeromicrobium sp. CF4.19]|uniref:HNH endonuclease family protein n=1 Tax=Aeromicrobium sp. CF4.19 TaxID=3373082 RepID=UPI003EE702A4